MTDQSPSREAVEVTQGDRDAAASTYTGMTRHNVLSGGRDEYPLVQAFARHRLAARREAIEEAAGVALEQRCERGTPWDRACVAIAAAIRGVGVE